MISVSVSEVNVTPWAVSRSRSTEALSMIPLWTTVIRPSSLDCGWAFSSVAGPCVAHRVCPMPTLPDSRRGSAASRSRTRPTFRNTCGPLAVITAIPAES